MAETSGFLKNIPSDSSVKPEWRTMSSLIMASRMNEEYEGQRFPTNDLFSLSNSLVIFQGNLLILDLIIKLPPPFPPGTHCVGK